MAITWSSTASTSACDQVQLNSLKDRIHGEQQSEAAYVWQLLASVCGGGLLAALGQPA